MTILLAMLAVSQSVPVLDKTPRLDSPPVLKTTEKPVLPPLRPMTAYESAVREAAKQGKPLAIFVGQDAIPIPGWITLRYDSLDVRSPCVLIRKNGDVWRIGGEPTVEQIRRVGQPTSFVPQQVQPMFQPSFSQPFFGGRLSNC